MRNVVLVALLAVGCGPSSRPVTMPPPVPVPVATRAATDASPARGTPLADSYRDVAARIVEAGRTQEAIDAGFARLRHLTDRIGHRLAGSKALDEAIAWAAKTMRADGHDVRLEKVMVPRWVRGAESARLLTPVERSVAVLGLGGTVATPKGGVKAPVVVVRDWKELQAAGEKGLVKGKIVLYDVAMPAWSEEGGTGYSDVVGYRWAGASAAAKYGAVASLVRSVTSRSLATPHTGSMGYADGVPKIPTAAISIEDAELIARLEAAGEEVKLELRLGAKVLPDVESANVIGELRGTELPDEVVVIGAHIDSWDVGQGAHDDGAGCVAVMQALTLLRQLGLAPRRTIRVVLFTNEENGLRGAAGYAAQHKHEIDKHVMALEMDMGGFAPWGFQVDREGSEGEGGQARVPAIVARVGEIASLLEPIGATRAEAGHGGADISPLAQAGVPALGLWTDSRTYFDYHHTEADTLDKVDPKLLADDAVAIAVIAYVVADMPGRLDDPLPSGEP